MSSSHDAHGDTAAAHHHDDHAFDGEPAKELSPGEPRTPSWLPMLGAALFVAGGIYLLARGGDAADAEGSAPPPVPVTAAVAAPPMPMPQPQQQPRPIQAGAVPSGAKGIQGASPGQAAELQKKIDDLKARGLMPKGKGAAAPPGGHP